VFNWIIVLTNKIFREIDIFAQIHKDGLLYADKTEMIYKLVKEKAPYFLSLPRCFGKYLLASTIKAVLPGRR
jgi:hypothetical protein